jgi:methionyl-tRNA synthetase
MIGKYFDGVLPPEQQEGDTIMFEGFDWKEKCNHSRVQWSDLMNSFSLAKAADIAMGLIRDVDLFINDTAPFKLAKDDTKKPELSAILYQSLETLRIASVLLSPIIPKKMATFHEAIGFDGNENTFEENTRWGGLTPGSEISKVALFPRI